MHIDEAVKSIMDDYDLDEDTTERVRDIMDEEGIDLDEAVELVDEF